MKIDKNINVSSIIWQSYFFIVIAISPLALIVGNTFQCWFWFIIGECIGILGIRTELFKEFKGNDLQ